MSENCCPPQEESDQWCVACASQGEGHEKRKAKKGFMYCSDCWNQLFAPI